MEAHTGYEGCLHPDCSGDLCLLRLLTTQQNKQYAGALYADRSSRTRSRPSRRRVVPRTPALLMLLSVPLCRAQTAPDAHRIESPSRSPAAIQLSVRYLRRACDESGRFAYLVDSDSGHLSRSYNIVRHAGAVYSLEMANRLRPDTATQDTIVRAGGYLWNNYVGPDANSDVLAVWTRPKPDSFEAELGAAGLGLVALTEIERLRPNSMSLPDLRALGRFILFMQKENGSFFSKYRIDSGPVAEIDSLYYPGEATLGLIALYELDHSSGWLTAAGKALAFLARSDGGGNIAPDHWDVIATAAFLPHYDQSSCAASRKQLIEHAERICERFLSEQITSGSDAAVISGFDPGGRTTPAATRLEALLAALEFLPPEANALRGRIEIAVKRGVTFLLNAQITSGPYAGGMPATAIKPKSVVFRADPKSSEIRIDYVQHALSAWLRYESIFGKK